jgi:poly(beta-D-mannuronate) lyase
MHNALLVILAFIFFPVSATAEDVLFNVEQRVRQLSQPEYAEARRYCRADNVKWEEKLPKPIPGLRSTEGYGSDNRAAKLSWYAMIQASRAMAGDRKARKNLIEGLLTWAHAEALTKGDHAHDTYYALKRYMLPVIISLSVVDKDMTDEQRNVIIKWIDRIVPPLDKKFDGDVDHNNHRYLADSVLMAWGAYKNDAQLYNIGVRGFKKALRDARPDGSLPLETRRGSRATWYIRHALSSLVTIAEIDRTRGGNLYRLEINGKSLATIVNYYISASSAPLLILSEASQNYIPGPNSNYLEQDKDYMRRRGHDRHYMAFAEAYIHQPTLAAKRLNLMMKQETGWKQRPYIDEYVGGNASCFYWQPEKS